MSTIVTIVHVLVCIFLMLTVLLQAGKGGGMGAAFGGGVVHTGQKVVEIVAEQQHDAEVRGDQVAAPLLVARPLRALAAQQQDVEIVAQREALAPEILESRRFVLGVAARSIFGLLDAPATDQAATRVIYIIEPAARGTPGALDFSRSAPDALDPSKIQVTVSSGTGPA